ncbi:MAG TPA: hypothetical protein VGE63_00065 [Candidatus Paceibacterota bacterium]
MITTLTEDSLRKIDMIIFYRKDVERFLRSSTLKLMRESYAHASLMPTQKTPQLVNVMEIMPIVAQYKKLLMELKEEIHTVEQHVNEHKPGLFGRSRHELFEQEYAHESRTSTLARTIEQTQIMTERILLAIQKEKKIYGQSAYMPVFLDLPKTLDEFAQLKHLVGATIGVLNALAKWYEESQEKFEQAFEMVFIEPFSDFGIRGTTYKKFLENKNINTKQHYKIPEFIDLFESYCNQVIADIPENLALEVKEYKDLLTLSTQTI